MYQIVSIKKNILNYKYKKKYQIVDIEIMCQIVSIKKNV